MYRKYEENRENYEKFAEQEERRLKQTIRSAFIFGILTALLLYLYQPRRSYYVDEYGMRREMPIQNQLYDSYGRPYTPMPYQRQHNYNQQQYDYGAYR